eukprot:scaffold14477_cov164-Amphora_coffeaeformis.AAC.4
MEGENAFSYSDGDPENIRVWVVRQQLFKCQAWLDVFQSTNFKMLRLILLTYAARCPSGNIICVRASHIPVGASPSGDRVCRAPEWIGTQSTINHDREKGMVPVWYHSQKQNGNLCGCNCVRMWLDPNTYCTRVVADVDGLVSIRDA